MLEAIYAGLVALFTPQAMLFMVLGIVYGLVIGILPGLGGVVADGPRERRAQSADPPPERASRPRRVLGAVRAPG